MRTRSLSLCFLRGVVEERGEGFGDFWGCLGMFGNVWECLGMFGDVWGVWGGFGGLGGFWVLGLRALEGFE